MVGKESVQMLQQDCEKEWPLMKEWLCLLKCLLKSQFKLC